MQKHCSKLLVCMLAMPWLLYRYHRLYNVIAFLRALAKPKFTRHLYLTKLIMLSLWTKPLEAEIIRSNIKCIKAELLYNQVLNKIKIAVRILSQKGRI